MTDYTHFRYEVGGEDGVALLTFTRPDTLNSLTFEIYADLERLFLEARTDARIRAIVITGEGKGFCSGGNVEEIIGELLTRGPADTLAFTRMTGAVVENMRRLDKPIVAAVNGVAAGAGAVLALASDLRVVADSASFAFLFTRVGLTGADMGAAFLLPKVVGAGRAAEMLLLGEKVDAARALEAGLANKVVPQAETVQTALEWARKLAQGPPLALGLTKRLLVNETDMDLSSAIEQEALAQAILLKCADHEEFYRSWKEKRPPRFTGR
jgi:enoyl-CoA hydratase/carnithine racemase